MSFDPSRPPENRSAEDRLDSWKAIAGYLGKNVRTVQRWEREEDLPVLRHLHLSRSTVFAFKEDLDEWLGNKSQKPGAPDPPKSAPRGPILLGSVMFSLLVAMALTVAVSWEDLHFLHFESLTGRPASVPLTTYLGHEIHPSLSPLGDFVAYSWDGGTGENDDIYVEQVGSGKPLRRTRHAAPDYSPSWSPDGSAIAFLRAETEMSEIVLTPPLSGAERVLASVQSPPPSWGPQLTWSPDGNWLVTSQKRGDRDTFGLYLVEVSSGKGFFVTDPPQEIRGDHSPAFSPDGEFLAFVRSVGHDVSDLHVMRVGSGSGDWSDPVRVSDLGTEVSAPTWTPSGKKIVFSAGSWPRARLWRIDPLPGATPESLPLAGEAAYFPRITGRHRLVFSRYAVASNIWFVDLDSGEKTKALFSSSGLDSLPEYSPNGARIAFTSDRSGEPELWLSDPDGTRQLTELRSSHTGDVSWSPDGAGLSFDSVLEGNADVFVIHVGADETVHPLARTGSIGLMRLTDHPSEDRFPRWSADGRFIYFCSKRSGSYELWRVSAEGGEATQVTGNGGWFAAESPDGRHLYFTKWREPGIWRKSLSDSTVSKLTDEPAGRLAAVGNGIYFMAGGPVERHEVVLKHMDLKSGVIRVVHRDEKRPAGGWSLSPAANRVALAQYDLDGADLVLIDAFSCKKLVAQGFRLRPGGALALCAF